MREREKRGKSGQVVALRSAATGSSVRLEQPALIRLLLLLLRRRGSGSGNDRRGHRWRKEKEEEDDDDRDDPTFQPEWMRVLPEDKELRAYLRWLWMQEGWDWDPRTGEREVLPPALYRAVQEGRVRWDVCGRLEIL